MLKRLLMLHTVIICIWFASSATASAEDKFWFANRVEFGYGRTFIRDSFTVIGRQIIRNRASVGLNFKLSDKISYRTFYLLNNSLNNNWKPDHQFGAQLNFKLE